MRNDKPHPRVKVFGALLCLGLTALLSGPASAVSTTWDALLTDSHWYVPEENLLAYMGSGTSFTSPPPIVLWDQTLWALGTAVDGRFSGSSEATFYASPSFSFSQNTSILGIATEAGQIRMQFTTGTDGSTTIGIGQFRDVGGTTAAQMQMISGAAGGPYTTHWAYMLPYDPTTFTPPDPRPRGWPDGTADLRVHWQRSHVRADRHRPRRAGARRTATPGGRDRRPRDRPPRTAIQLKHRTTPFSWKP